MGHRTENCWALKTFLDHLVRERHLKEFTGQEKIKPEEAEETEETEIKPNSRFNQSNEDTDNNLEDDLPLGTIHWSRHVLADMHNGDLEIQTTWEGPNMTM